LLLRTISIAAISLLALAPSSPAQRKLQSWLTTPDKANLLKQQAPIKWHKVSAAKPDSITVDDSKIYQTIDGFGQAVTGGSAELLMKMSPAARSAILHEVFGHGPDDINTSYIRVSVGSSDMNAYVYTYDDMPAGQTDPDLKHFTMAEEEKYVIPVLKEILAIQPNIKILASPWTAPAWMKDNDAVKGGSLKHENYSIYARYWVEYLKGMEAHGIHIDALTPQNEPENPKNTPSMLMTAEEEAEFIGHDLGPALASAGLHAKVVTFDHNCDHPIYAETILRDPAAAKFVDGSGFHLYLGEISALSEVHDQFPSKNIYFTEQTVLSRPGATAFAIARPVAAIMIAAPNNWSRNVLLWNLAADPNNGPHTSDGGCPVCSGAITIDGDKVTRLLAYYTAAHASKFVPPGSVRIDSGESPVVNQNRRAARDASHAGNPDISTPVDKPLPHVAFRTPDNRYVVIVSNTSPDQRHVTLRFHKKQAEASLPGGAVATYVF
jgi:glucosylceramidase